MNIKEIAQIAGVSPATISLVLNNKKGVSDKRRKEILQIIKDYDYVIPRKTHAPSRNLLFLKYRAHGLVVEENAGFIQSIMDSIEIECHNLNYNLGIVNSINNLELILSGIDFSNYHGMFVLGTELDDSFYSLLKKVPIPYVVIDNIMPDFSCNAIAIDNYTLVRKAVQYLSSLHFQSIGYLQSNISIQNFEERQTSFESIVQHLPFEYSKAHCIQLTPTMQGAYRDMKQLLNNNITLPRCLFADNDTIAIGAIKALKEKNYSMPEDIAIIGFDDIHFASINSPSLSTIHICRDEIGTLALKQLNYQLDFPNAQYHKIRVGGNLVKRHTTQRKTKVSE